MESKFQSFSILSVIFFQTILYCTLAGCDQLSTVKSKIDNSSEVGLNNAAAVTFTVMPDQKCPVIFQKKEFLKELTVHQNSKICFYR